MLRQVFFLYNYSMKIFGYTLAQLWDLLMAWLVSVFPPSVNPPSPTPAPPAPTPPGPNPTPAPPPVPPDAGQLLTSIIEAYNTPYVSYYPTGSTTVNSQIHKIDAATAAQVADLIVTNAKAQGLDITYFAACIMQESRFDPNCFDNNLSATNPTPTFARTDWGMCQMSGQYLPSKPGMSGLTDAEMQAKACDPTWSVPEMAVIMAGNLAWANQQLLNATLAAATTKLNTTDLSNQEFLATLAYNRGNTGAVTYIETGNTAMIQHPYHVATWYDDFRKVFGSNNVPTT